MLNIYDPLYPSLLKEIHSAPKKLFYRGDLNVLQKPCISIVGTRRHSEYGEYVTEKIVSELAVMDITIVSGLARGIDTIAHKMALKNHLATIAVLGSGFDHIYPQENIGLCHEIEKSGLLISEYPDDMQPLKMNFPQRNRLISGLSLATVVIEAPDKSGALITANFALEQGREIFVIPGDIDRPTSIGTLKLLQNGGAYPISSGWEIIEMLKKQPNLFKNIPPPPVPKIPEQSIFPALKYNLNPDEQIIFSMLNPYRGTSLEKIIEKSLLSTQKVLTAISLLEIKNLVKNSYGKYKRK